MESFSICIKETTVRRYRVRILFHLLVSIKFEKKKGSKGSKYPFQVYSISLYKKSLLSDLRSFAERVGLFCKRVGGGGVVVVSRSNSWNFRKFVYTGQQRRVPSCPRFPKFRRFVTCYQASEATRRTKFIYTSPDGLWQIHVASRAFVSSYS